MRAIFCLALLTNIAAAERIELPAKATTADAFAALGKHCPRRDACFFVPHASTDGVATVTLVAGASSLEGTLTSNRAVLGRLLEGRAISAELVFISRREDFQAPRQIYFGPQGGAYLGRPLGMTGADGPAAEIFKDWTNAAALLIDLAPPPETLSGSEGLAFPDVQRAFSVHYAALGDCFRDKKLALSGAISIDILVAADGSITTLAPLFDSVPDAVRACLLTTFRRVAFPKPTKAPTLLSLPVIFAKRP